MKNIDKLIIHYVLEIILVIILVVVSFPVWKMLNKSDSAKIAKSYANMDYLYLDIDKYISQNDFEDVVSVVNDTNTKRGYQLIVKIPKEKITNDANILINDKKVSMDSIKLKENGNYLYYILSQDTVVANEKKYEIKYLNSNINYSEIEYELIESHEV